MDAHRQRFDLRSLEHQIQLFLRQFEVMLSGDVQFNQTHVIVAGDNLGAGAGRQYALDARRALLRLVAAAQLKIDIAAGDRLQGAGMQHRRRPRQLAGFVRAQQRQQAGVFHLARVGAVYPGHVAPDGDARSAGQRADLSGGVVTAVTPQQHGFPGVVARNEAGHHRAFARMLSQQLLQQRIRTAFIHLWLRGALGAQEVTRIQPGRLHVQWLSTAAIRRADQISPCPTTSA